MRKVLYFLGQLSDTDVEWLIRHGARQQVPAGACLIEAGQPVGALYVVLDGALAVAVPGQRQVQTAHLGSGDVVGEMSFVDARPPSATVKVLEDAVLLSIPRPKLAAKLEEDTAFAARFYRGIAMFLSHRLRLLYAGGRELGDEDELDPNVLDQVHLAGTRFDVVLQRLLGE
jgi:CRP-like cAMP-binding protein